MSKLWSFHSLTKDHEDILLKNYTVSSLGSLSFLSRFLFPSVTFRGKTNRKESTASTFSKSSASLTQKLDWISWELLRKSNGTGKITAKYLPTKFLEGVKFRGEVDFDYKDSLKPTNLAGWVSAFGSTHNYTLGVSEEPASLMFTGTYGKLSYGIGTHLYYNLDSNRLSELSFAGWWFKQETKLVVKYNPLELSLKLYYTQRLTDATSMATTIKSKMDRKDSVIRIGTAHWYDENTQLKAKVNSYGVVGLAAIRRLSENVQISVGAQLDSNQMKWGSMPNSKFGVKLNLNYW